MSAFTVPPLMLSHGKLRLALRPDLGGCIAGLWCGDVPILRSTPPAQLESVRSSASYPLVPFSNRIGSAQLHWAGDVIPLAANFAPEPHAIHGVGWTQAWDVQAVSANTATLRYRHSPDASWPFAFEAVQTFTLDADGLHLSLTAINLEARPVPMGMGWHPFFVKRPSSRVRFQAAGRWAMGDDKLPTHRDLSQGVDDYANALDIDHCFDGWQGTLHLEDELMQVQLQSSLTHLVVFTNASKDFIAIEPVSHVNNALGKARSLQELAAMGIHVLAPQATWEATAQLDIKTK